MLANEAQVHAAHERVRAAKAAAATAPPPVSDGHRIDAIAEREHDGHRRGPHIRGL
jgi:hypothetical protein